MAVNTIDTITWIGDCSLPPCSTLPSARAGPAMVRQTIEGKTNINLASIELEN